jgi:hypothetical protein
MYVHCTVQYIGEYRMTYRGPGFLAKDLVPPPDNEHPRIANERQR